MEGRVHMRMAARRMRVAVVRCIDSYVPLRQYSARCSLERSGRMERAARMRVLWLESDGDVAFGEL